MKVVLVIDSITDLNNKVNMLKTRFGNDILYIVKSNLVNLVKTYGINPNAIYKNNLIKAIHILLSYNLNKDVIICYSSVNLDNNLLNKFTSKIGDKTKTVNVMPFYNAFEKLNNNAYNIYVKSLFSTEDTLISSKLQFIPSQIVMELISTHFGNRLFLKDPSFTTTIYLEKGKQSESLKAKTRLSKFHLIPVIIALIITMALILTMALTKINYVIILVFTFLYLTTIFVSIIFSFKAKFDKRFMQ